MIPTLHVLAIDGTPRLWPMGIGAGQPRAIQALVGAPGRIELDWDAAGRLTETRYSLRPQPPRLRLEYVWNDDQLERIREFDPKLVEIFGDQPRSELIWTWADGRPVKISNVSNEDGQEVSREEWVWADDGRSLTTTESSDHILAKITASLDADGRVRQLEREYTIDGSKEIINLSWSSDGRLLEARTPTGTGPELVIGFRWDDRGRLVAQTRSDMPGGDVYQYEYDEP
jgi:YD repeat-containing protein